MDFKNYDDFINAFFTLINDKIKESEKTSEEIQKELIDRYRNLISKNSVKNIVLRIPFGTLNRDMYCFLQYFNCSLIIEWNGKTYNIDRDNGFKYFLKDVLSIKGYKHQMQLANDLGIGTTPLGNYIRFPKMNKINLERSYENFVSIGCTFEFRDNLKSIAKAPGKTEINLGGRTQGTSQSGLTPEDRARLQNLLTNVMNTTQALKTEDADLKAALRKMENKLEEILGGKSI